MFRFSTSISSIIDRLSVIEIKAESINDKEKTNYLQKEYYFLVEKLSKKSIEPYIKELKILNKRIWDAFEKAYELKESDTSFSCLFQIILDAKKEKLKVKKEIDKKFKSEFIDYKTYEEL